MNLLRYPKLCKAVIAANTQAEAVKTAEAAQARAQDAFELAEGYLLAIHDMRKSVLRAASELDLADDSDSRVIAAAHGNNILAGARQRARQQILGTASAAQGAHRRLGRARARHEALLAEVERIAEYHKAGLHNL